MTREEFEGIKERYERAQKFDLEKFYMNGNIRFALMDFTDDIKDLIHAVEHGLDDVADEPHETDELLPCPFCGSKAYLVRHAGGFNFNCKNFFNGCFKSKTFEVYPTKKEAVSDWNTRAKLSEPLLKTVQCVKCEDEQKISDRLSYKYCPNCGLSINGSKSPEPEKPDGLIINGVEYDNITVADKDGGVCAVISADDNILHNDYEIHYDVGVEETKEINDCVRCGGIGSLIVVSDRDRDYFTYYVQCQNDRRHNNKYTPFKTKERAIDSWNNRIIPINSLPDLELVKSLTAEHGLDDVADEPPEADELLPCPFCGVLPKYSKEYAILVRCTKYTVTCPICKMQVSDTIKSGLFEKWNTRANLPQPENQKPEIEPLTPEHIENLGVAIRKFVDYFKKGYNSGK